jgi:hypothetical protein
VSDTGRQRVLVPADTELPDKLVAGLTGRQVVITAIAVLVIWAGYMATRTVLPLPVFAVLAAPAAVIATALAIGQRDGLTLDRLLAAAWRQARSPRRMVTAPEGVPAVPGWVAPGLARRAGPPAAPVRPPWQLVTPDRVIGLGGDGGAAVCAVSTVNFALRSPAEQDALTAAYGRWLHSLTGPVQILIRTGHADLASAITRLRQDAPALPHPALEQAALNHARFLARLGATRQVLTRQVLLVTREAGRAAPGRPGSAAGRAAQRTAEAARLLASADLQARPLDGAQVTALLAAACDPGGPHRAQRLAPPGPLTRHGHAVQAAPLPRGMPGAGQDGLPAPPAVKIAARHVEIDGDCAATLAVTGYPAEVAPGWLEPLTSYPGRLDIALHIEPVPPAVAADRLRRQRARLESSRRTWAGQGRLDDPATEAAAEDARALAYQVARGEGKLFRLGLYLTVHGEDADDLAGQVAGVRALADSLLLSTAPATYRSLQGWVTTLPAGTDALKIRRTMDTASLAAAFPFSSPDLPRDPAAPDPLPGVLYGASASGPGLVAWDRWAQDNHNSVTLATSGAGKSYLGKLEISRQLYAGTECWVVDPEDEYARLAAALGGAYIHLGAPGVHLNPFDLPDPARARPDALMRRALFLHTVVAVLTGAEPAPAEKAALDTAIMAAYHHAGITADRRTWARPAPLLADLADALRAGGTPPAVTLADRLAPYTGGTHSALFSAATTTRPAGHLVVFSLRDLPEELKAVGTLLALDATWRRVSNPAARGRRRLITVDEAWLLMRDPEGARFLFRMAKASRKHHAGLAAITQDAEDVLSTDLGRAVIANSATQILLRQSPQAIGKVAAWFRLSAGERSLLLSAARGTGLLAAGPSARVCFEALASPEENSWCTSDPAEIARLQARQPAGTAAAPPPPGDADEDMLP